uniref:Uncharacterized protein n=1 Tax=Parastrongyloides trichosuri TaxID=131310 RepID=A0A0N5A4F6_PARTI
MNENNNTTELTTTDLKNLNLKILKIPSPEELSPEKREECIIQYLTETKNDTAYSEFEEIFSVKTFNQINEDLNKSTNITNKKIIYQLKKLTLWLPEYEFKIFPTKERILQLLPIFASILKKRIDVHLKFQILTIVRYCYHFLFGCKIYDFKCKEMENYLTSYGSSFSSYFEKNANHDHNSMRTLYYCKNLALCTVLEVKRGVLDEEYEENMSVFEYIEKSLRKTHKMFCDTIFEKASFFDKITDYIFFRIYFIQYRYRLLTANLVNMYHYNIGNDNVNPFKFMNFIASVIMEIQCFLKCNIIKKDTWEVIKNIKLRHIIITFMEVLHTSTLFIANMPQQQWYLTHYVNIKILVNSYERYLKKNPDLVKENLDDEDEKSILVTLNKVCDSYFQTQNNFNIDFLLSKE